MMIMLTVMIIKDFECDFGDKGGGD